MDVLFHLRPSPGASGTSTSSKTPGRDLEDVSRSLLKEQDVSRSPLKEQDISRSPLKEQDRTNESIGSEVVERNARKERKEEEKKEKITALPSKSSSGYSNLS